MASTSTSTVVFVLGGPGSGKGTQCKRLTEHFGFVHFSAGDLLRAFVKSGTEEGNQVAAMMQEGKIVPSEVTVNLLKKAMEESGKDKFLIDGFPRNLENRDTFLRVVSHERKKEPEQESYHSLLCELTSSLSLSLFVFPLAGSVDCQVGHDCSFVLFFDCPEEVLEARLLNRGEGRADDNIETIRKRFKTYQDQTMPVIEHYKGLDKVREVKTDVGIDQVWEVVSGLFK